MRRPRGAALVLVIVLVFVALSVAALLVATSQTARRAADEREEATRARLGAMSAVNAALAALNGTGSGDIDGRVDSLDSIHPATGAPANLRDLPDGSFTVRLEKRGASAAGPHYVLTAYAKWGAVARGVGAIAEPVRPRAHPAGFFGDLGVSIAGNGRVMCYDSASGSGDAVAGAALLGSNGDISLGSSSATGGSADPTTDPRLFIRRLVSGRYRLSGGAPFFLGSIYAPRADVQISNLGAGGGGGMGKGLDVMGSATPGKGAGLILGPNANVTGSTAPRDAVVPLSAARAAPPADVPSGGALIVGLDLGGPAEVWLGPGTLVYDRVAVSGGTIRISGKVDLYVVGDLEILSAGSIVLDGDATLRIFAGGSIRLAGEGIRNPGPASRLSISCAADSAVKPSAGVVVKARGAVAGAIAGRKLKVTGTPVDLRFDRALAESDTLLPAYYRVKAVTEIPPPW